jgi:S-adenosylmethionine hydrolase
MIVLFTDFGLEGPYIGQVQAVLQQQAPGMPVINLFADLPPFAIQGAASLLPVYVAGFLPASVFLCVVDPGVGSARPGVVVQADDRWFVGPNEGLFAMLARQSSKVVCWQLAAPDGASAAFTAVMCSRRWPRNWRVGVMFPEIP